MKQDNSTLPSVDWWITSRCNLRCDFCYGPMPARDPVDIREGISAAIAQSHSSATTFCGGEPLLVPDIYRFAKQQVTAGKKTILNTNGELLDGRRMTGDAEDLPFDVVGISIDGPTDAVHRAMRGNSARFDLAVSAAERIARLDSTDLKVATVVSRVNFEHLEDLVPLVKRLNPIVWRIYQYSPWGPVNYGRDRHLISDVEFLAISARLRRAACPIAVCPSGTRDTAGCVIVDPVGDVLVPTPQGYRTLGNCLDQPIDAIWRRHPLAAPVVANKSWHAYVRHPIARQKGMIR